MDTHHRTETPKPPPPWVNRMMSRLLRSPLSRLVDRGIVLLSVTGRRSGHLYTFPVQYVQEGGTLWIMTGGHEGKSWWRNVVGGAPVEVLLRRTRRRGQASAFEGGTDPEVVTEGMRRYLERFPRTAKRIGIPPDDEEAFARAVARTVIVRVLLDRG